MRLTDARYASQESSVLEALDQKEEKVEGRRGRGSGANFFARNRKKRSAQNTPGRPTDGRKGRDGKGRPALFVLYRYEGSHGQQGDLKLQCLVLKSG